MPTKHSAIISLARVRARRRCPKCGHLSVRRSAKPQKSAVSMNGAALWDLRESCTMCPWSKSYPNVKIGA